MTLHPMLIDGEWVDQDNTLMVDDPESGEEVGRVPVATVEDVESAVLGARRATMKPLPGHERSRILSGAADLLDTRIEEAATLIATEGIKTIREARAEARRAVATLRLSAEQAKRISGDTLNFDQYPTGVGSLGVAFREPVGVVAAITPFNDPLNLVAHKVGPALASGNAVVLKPDSKTPLSALALAGDLMTAGLPPGWLQVLTGPGPVVGNAIVTHRGVDMVSFTGGVEAGRAIHASAGLKKVAMELGANNPVIVDSDADVGVAIERIGSGAFWAAGQNCLHVQRILVHRDVEDELTNGLSRYASSLEIGPKLDESTDMGPMIDLKAVSRTNEIVNDAVDRGAEALCGAEPKDRFYLPTLLSDVQPGSRVLDEEIYAPVSVITRFDDISEAIARANDSDYGLAGAVFTSDISTAFLVAARLKTGQVMINESTDFRIDSMPFGGGGASGIGREGVAYAVAEMTEPKVIAFAGVEVPGLG